MAVWNREENKDKWKQKKIDKQSTKQMVLQKFRHERVGTIKHPLRHIWHVSANIPRVCDVCCDLKIVFFFFFFVPDGFFLMSIVYKIAFCLKWWEKTRLINGKKEKKKMITKQQLTATISHRW